MAAVITWLLAAGLAVQTASTSSDVELIRLPVVAVDDTGQPVADLEAPEFEVLDAGRALTVEEATFIASIAAGAPASSEPPSPILSRADELAAAADPRARIVAIFLDDYHVSPGRPSEVVRDALGAFVMQLHRHDLVLLVRPLDSLLDLRATRDIESVLREVAAFEGRKGDYAPRTPIEAQLMAASPERAEPVRAQIATSAMMAMVTHLAGLAERQKALVLVSEGYQALGRRRGDPLPTTNAVVRAASRAGVSIHALDPIATDPVLGAADRATLDQLTEGTRGPVWAGESAPATGLERVLTDLGGYYLLTVRVPAAVDAQPRPIAVRSTRPGVETMAPDGYWPPITDDFLRAELEMRAAAPPAPRPPPLRTSRLIRPWFGVTPNDDGTAAVSFVWEPTPVVPGTRARTEPPAAVRLTAETPDGDLLFDGLVAPAGGSDNRVAGLSKTASFVVPAGPLNLRIAIADRDSRVIDLDTRQLSVPSFGGRVALGDVAVLRARTALEYRSFAGDPGAPATPSREFSRTDRLLFRVVARVPGSDPQVSASLASRLGGSMRDLSVDRVPGGDEGAYQVDLPLAGLATGEYRVSIVAAGSAGEVSEDVAFRVIP